MADERLRELERSWRAEGAQAARPYLRALVQAGAVTPQMAALAWRCARAEQAIQAVMDVVGQTGATPPLESMGAALRGADRALREAPWEHTALLALHHDPNTIPERILAETQAFRMDRNTPEARLTLQNGGNPPEHAHTVAVARVPLHPRSEDALRPATGDDDETIRCRYPIERNGRMDVCGAELRRAVGDSWAATAVRAGWDVRLEGGDVRGRCMRHSTMRCAAQGCGAEADYDDADGWVTQYVEHPQTGAGPGDYCPAHSPGPGFSPAPLPEWTGAAMGFMRRASDAIYCDEGGPGAGHDYALGRAADGSRTCRRCGYREPGPGGAHAYLSTGPARRAEIQNAIDFRACPICHVGPGFYCIADANAAPGDALMQTHHRRLVDQPEEDP